MIRDGDCPYCGQDMPDDLETPALQFPGLYGRIVDFLAEQRRFGLHTSMDEIIDAVYAGSKRGAPVHAQASIVVTMHRCRKDLIKHGWDILGPKATRHNGYMLVKLKE